MKTSPTRQTLLIFAFSFAALLIAFGAADSPKLSIQRSTDVNQLSWPGTLRKADGSISRPFFELQRSADLRQWKPFGERLRAPVTATDQILSITPPLSDSL